MGYLVDQDGMVIIHSNPQCIGEQVQEALQPLISSSGQVSEYVDPWTGFSKLAAYSPVENELGWIVVVEQPWLEAYSPVLKFANVSLAILSSCAVHFVDLFYTGGKIFFKTHSKSGFADAGDNQNGRSKQKNQG